MRNDQIFVLMLVILLPMSGCFDGAVGDAEAEEETVVETENQLPVFHIAGVGSSDETRSTYNTTTGDEETRMYYSIYKFWFSVYDADGSITQVGLDIDLDSEIDYEFTTNGSWSDFSYHESFGMAWSNTTMANPIGSSQWGHEPIYCFHRFSLIALDNDGGTTVVPYTPYVGNNQGCDVSMDD